VTGRRFPFDPEAFRWAGIEPRTYKPDAGRERGMGWKGVSRHVLASSGVDRDRPGRAGAVAAAYELRYFELEPGGYSSLEKHRHEHFVIALRGAGRALVGQRVLDLVPFDALHVPSSVPHRWLNEGEQPFGFLCPVDRERDRPAPLDDDEWEALLSSPATARYAF
jgi:quercetin dioxygenase-like cupin family protein